MTQKSENPNYPTQTTNIELYWVGLDFFFRVRVGMNFGEIEKI